MKAIVGVGDAIDEVAEAIVGVGEAIDGVGEAIDGVEEAIDGVGEAIDRERDASRWRSATAIGYRALTVLQEARG